MLTPMNSMRIFLTRSFLVTGLLLGLLPNVHATMPATLEISRLFAEEKHDEVVKRLSGVSWNLTSDPFLVMVLCSSRLELEHTLMSCIDDSHAVPGVVTFGKGLTSLWSGKSRTAISMFQNLARDPNTTLWGYLGLFEHAEYTGNFTELGKLIERFHKKYATVPESFRKQVYHYEVVFLQETGDWDKLETSLSRFSREQIIRAPDLLAANYRLLYVRAKLTQARELLEAARRELGSSDEFQRLYVEYLQLTEGKQAADDFLQQSVMRRPDYTALSVEFAYSRLQANNQKDVEAAVKELEQLATARPHDVARVFGIALSLANYQKLEGSSRILRKLTHSIEAPEDFTAFQNLEAWNAVYSGRLDAAKSYVKTAITRSPYDQSANWLSFLIAKKESRWSEASAALIRVFNMDPYNENVVVSLLELRGQGGKSSQTEAMLEEIKSRLKWYRPEIQERIKNAKK